MNNTFCKIISYFIILLTLCGCTRPENVKPFPEYTGVDPKAKGLVDEYLWLSKQNRIEFDDIVSVGFKNINQGTVVGMCTFGRNFREIDVDLAYWNQSTALTHIILIFHELTHCYCTRGHDYGKDKNYPESRQVRIDEAYHWFVDGIPRPGHWNDGCPMSLMYPEVVGDDCARAHYNAYIQEMFDRCDPF